MRQFISRCRKAVPVKHELELGDIRYIPFAIGIMIVLIYCIKHISNYQTFQY